MTKMIKPTTSADRLRWVPYVALGAGAALLLKALLIIGSGDEVADAPIGVLYLIGIVATLVTAVGVGLRQRKGRRTLVALVLVILAAAWLLAIGDALAPVFGVFSDAEYVNDEGPIALLGAGLLLYGARSPRGGTGLFDRRG